MDPLSAIASVIAILQLSAKVLSYLNDVKDTSKGHAQCATEASNLHHLLTNLRYRLEEGHGHQPWFSAVQALAVENGPLSQFKQALETLQTKMTDGGRLKKAREALLWKFKKEEVDAILARMERLKTLVEIALQMDHFKLSQAIKDDTGSILAHVSDIESAVNKVQQVQVTETQRTLLGWISSSDYPAQQSDIIKRRQEGTGQWFLDAPEVARWLDDAKTTLFCPGIPGAGKTMVAAIAVSQLLDSAQSGTYGVAYVYCNYKSQADQDTVSILSAILKQLVQSQPSTLGPVERLHQKHAGRGTKPSLDDIYSALQDVLAQYPYVHIVVDALDECQNETREQLCTKLLDLQKGADVRLMVTSRFVLDVEDAFRQALKLEVQASDGDVTQFVAGQIHRLPACIQRDVALQDLVQRRIVEAADGMFLLARLHTDSLLDKRKPKEVKSTLTKLRKGEAALNSAYSGALQRIEGQLDNDRKLAKDVLSWITLAKRPLTTAELCCALAVEPGKAELDPENKTDVGDIVSVCAGLVVIDQESAIIRLVHYTTHEYFERISSRLNPDGHLEITETCLTYLSFSVFESGSCTTDKEFEERLRQHEFLDYAARYCGEHARYVEAEVTEAVRSFLTHNGLLACAVQVLYVGLSYNYDQYSKSYLPFTALHWAARFGLCEIAKRYMRIKGKEDGMHAVNATENGHDAVGKLLPNTDRVDVNAKDQGGRTPLSLAAAQGHDAVVKLLLDTGQVNADIQDERGRTPLSWASSNGSTAVAKLLLDTGQVDINAPNEHGWTPLLEAAFHGQDTVVKLLLNTDRVDVNAQAQDGRTPLSLAAAQGHDAVVKLLLDTGQVDINAPNEHG